VYAVSGKDKAKTSKYTTVVIEQWLRRKAWFYRNDRKSIRGSVSYTVRAETL
jgi:hypothetical protein